MIFSRKVVPTFRDHALAHHDYGIFGRHMNRSMLAWECGSPMQDSSAERGLSAVLVCVFLAGCSSLGGNPATLFADPGKYQYSSCAQLAGQQQYWSTREQELRSLMDRAEQSAGGALVNVLAYKADHVAASEELKVVENAARNKNCDSAESWRSNSVVR
jgi:hypothetical protein